MFSDFPVCWSLDACSHLEMMSQIWNHFGDTAALKEPGALRRDPHVITRHTLMPPCRQCSSSRPVGSSLYKLNPERPGFLMPVSWLRRHWNSSTVVEASKLTTCEKAENQSNARSVTASERRCITTW